MEMMGRCHHLCPQHRGMWHQGAGEQEHWGPVGRLSLPVVMETLLQEGHEGHRNPGHHKSRVLILASPKPGASRLTGDSSWSCSCPCKAPTGRGELGRGELGVGSEVAMRVQPAPAHARVCTVLPSFPLLPTSSQQVITTDCLLILISLGQGSPASQAALPPVTHLFIIVLVSTEGCCES